MSAHARDLQEKDGGSKTEGNLKICAGVLN